jgi:hypothetical protein
VQVIVHENQRSDGKSGRCRSESYQKGPNQMETAAEQAYMATKTMKNITKLLMWG